MLSRRDLLLGSACTPFLPRVPARLGGIRSAEDLLEKAKRLASDRSPVLRLLIPEGSAANVEPNAQAFEQATGIGVRLREVPVDEVSSRAILESATGEPSFDIALPATFGLPDLVEARALLALDEFAAQHEPAELSAGSLYTLGDRYKDKLYGYQTDGDVYLMFYNRNLMVDEALARGYADAFGKELAVPHTWEELDRQMQYMHAPEAGRFGGCLFRVPGYLEWEWWIRLHAKGVMPLDDEMHPQFQGDAGVEALEELIAASAWQSPGSDSQGLFDNWQDYAKGTAYANIGWGGTQKFLRSSASKVRDALIHGPTPGGIVKDQLVPISYFNWGWNYVVSIHSPEPELAYLFTLYASLPDRSTVSVRAQDGFFDPHRISHYADEMVAEVYSPGFLTQHQASMRSCIPDLYLQGRDEYFTKLGRLLDRANKREITPERALQLAARSWEHTTELLGRDGQVEQWMQLRKSYPQHFLDAQ